MSKLKEFAFLQVLNGRQILFLTENDDEGEPCITTKVRAEVGLVSFSASGYKSEDKRDEAFQKLKEKSDDDLQEQINDIDEMVSDMLGN